MAEAMHSETPSEIAAPPPDIALPLRLVWRARAARGRVLAAVSLAVISTAAELAQFYIVWHLADRLLAGTAGMGSFASHAAALVLAIAASTLLHMLALWQSHVAAFDILRDLRLRMARHMGKIPLGLVRARKSGEARRLMIDEPEKMELAIAHALPEGVSAALLWLVVSVLLFVVDWRMALAAIAVVPVSALALSVAMRNQFAWMKDYQAASERMNGAIVEYLAGMPVIRMFARSGARFAQTAQTIEDYVEMETRMGRAYIPLGGMFYTLILANICVILPVGIWLMSAGEITLSTLMLFVIFGANYSAPLMRLFNLMHNFAHISMSATAIQTLLDTAPQPEGTADTIGTHEVRLENVQFAYPGGAGDALSDVSFTARAGAVTALVGASGSGKSTAASLIPRFYDVDGGAITIGGHDVREMTISALMEEVAFVFQDTMLFTGTVAENIRYGDAEASEADVHAAARAAEAHGFITALPQSYDTPLGAGGVHLSGGEKQRIAIARAVLKDAPILILDEATAFADPDSEAAIQTALARLAQGRTVIMIAHRLHTIRDADRIVVMDQGRVAEQGRHDDLIAQNGIYAQLWADSLATGGLSHE